MHSDHDASPFNAVPPVVVALALAMVLPELAFQLADRGLLGGAAGVGWRIEAINATAFAPPLFDRAVETGVWSVGLLLRQVAYVFVHLDFLHMAFVAAFTLALGKMVGEVFHPLAVLGVFFGSAATGAAVYALVLDDPMALVGGFTAAYGMIGAYTFLLWTGLGAMGQNRLRAFQLIGFLMAIQLVFGLLFGATGAWVAEVSGFVTGFLLSFLVSPGGLTRLRERMRQR